jgi:hypothetical protein
MRYPVQTQDTPRISEPLLSALAVVAVGMFIGAWVIGPLASHKVAATATKEERMTYQAMLAKPDPFPYRTATPAFDTSARPGYGAAAREKARAELGGRRTVAGDPVADFQLQTSDNLAYRAPSRSRAMDRHSIH